jgi:V/A-type H+-transporting ATPase subunit E
VQELIDRIRDQGVQAAQAEADRLLVQARKQANEIVAQAKAEAEATQAKARAEIEAHRAASLDALQLATRDTVLDLKARVTARFEEFVKRLVVSATRDKELVRSIVLVLAGHAAEEFIQDKEIEVRISDSLLEGRTGPVFKEEGKLAILGLSSDMLREGLELVPDSEIEGGARVRLVKDKLEIDLSDRAIARMISQRILPRFKAILEGAE